MTAEERLRKLFRSNPESYIVRISCGAPSPSSGKVEAKYTTVRGSLSDLAIAAHLDGRACLVLKPPLPDGTCLWGMIDHDIYKDPEKVARIIKEVHCRELPLYSFPSKSGGLHNAIFFKDPQPLEYVRNQLLSWAGLVGDPKAEIFPKIVSKKKLDFGIALPFFGERPAFERFQPLLYVPPSKGADATSPKIGEGSRNTHLASLAGTMRRRGATQEAIEIALLAENRDHCQPPLSDDEVRGIARSISRYKPGIESEVENLYETEFKKLNEKFYIVEDLGGKCHVCWEKESQIFPGTVEFGHQSFSDFQNRFSHQLVPVSETSNGRVKYAPLGSAWIKWYGRRQYLEVAYAPGVELLAHVRNLWRGFAYEPKEGDCSLYLRHLFDNVCRSSTQRFNWLINWMAYAVQHPNEQGHTCPVLVGGQGVGKNSASDPFAKLWGSHYIIVTQPSQVAGHFNAHLRNCSVLVANEALFAGNRAHAGPLKGLITDEFLSIEAKGVDVTRTRNLLHVIICSNEEWVVPAEMDVRRFTVLQVSDQHKNDIPYFTALKEQLEHGGYAALLYHLLFEVDLKDFSPRQHLPTEELSEQKALSLRGPESVWYECLQRGSLPGKVMADGSVVLRCAELVDWAGKNPQWRGERLTTVHFGYLLGDNPRGRRKGMGFSRQKELAGGSRVNVYIIPPLNVARRVWNERRFPESWGEENVRWLSQYDSEH